MITWDARKVLIVTCICVGLVVAGALLGRFWRGATAPPSVPETTQSVATQTAVQHAQATVVTARTTNDEAVKNAYRLAKESVTNLSADAVVLELNLLLTDLRGGTARQQ